MEPLHRHKSVAYSAYVWGSEIFNVSSNRQMIGYRVKSLLSYIQVSYRKVELRGNNI